jgi:putative addiction module CopG family antidote
MNITLAAAQKQFVDAQVNSGRYIDASEVVRGALRLMEARHAVDHPVLGDLSTADVEALAFTVLMEAAKSERAYHQVLLRYLDPDGPGGLRMVKTDLHPGRIVRPRDLCVAVETVTSHLDGLSEMGEMESLRLQMAMERVSKTMSTLSNLLRKVSETSSAIVPNLK